jgi:hypothetical protein
MIGLMTGFNELIDLVRRPTSTLGSTGVSMGGLYRVITRLAARWLARFSEHVMQRATAQPVELLSRGIKIRFPERSLHMLWETYAWRPSTNEKRGNDA